jgi:hypothetical protein
MFRLVDVSGNASGYIDHRLVAEDPTRTFLAQQVMTQSGHRRLFSTRKEYRLGGQNCAYSPDSIARRSRKRMEPLLLRSEITKRTRPCPEVSAKPASVRTPETAPVL